MNFMNKLISIFSFCLSLTFFAVPSENEQYFAFRKIMSVPSIMVYDLDHDGKIDYNDFTYFKNFVNYHNQKRFTWKKLKPNLTKNPSRKVVIHVLDKIETLLPIEKTFKKEKHLIFSERRE